jgi:TolB-like protein/Tfp pilus assembly protein PilF
MSGPLGWIRRLVRELRRRQVIRVAVVYASAAFVVLQLGEILVDPFGLGGWALRLVLFLLVLGFPLAIGLAWVYNVTAEGVVREVGEETGEEEVDAQGSPFTSNGLIVGLLVVAIGLLLYPRVFSSEESSGEASPAAADSAQIEERSIAVLLFEPLSSGEESETFAQGIHDDLLTRLANISDLTVISRTAVQQYRDTELTTGEIADSLGVRWVMEGGVQVLQNQIQVNAQLIDPQTDTHVWADDYRRDLTAEDLFAIQGEITREIADALKAELTAGEQERIAGAPTENLEAYRLYAEGRDVLDQASSLQDVIRAAGHFGRALNRDSTYALAWAGLADSRVMQAPDSQVPDSLRLPDVSREAAARRALELAPNLAEAHAAMGGVHLGQGNGPAAVRDLQRALDLKPSYWEAHRLLGVFSLKTGRLQEALDHLQLAVELNPKHASARHGLYDAYLAAGQAKKSLKEARKQQRLGLESTAAIGGEVRALFGMGRLEEARRLAETQIADPDVRPRWKEWFRAYLVGINAAAGDTARAEKYLGQLQEAGVRPYKLAQGYTALGKTDRALDTYQRLNEEDWRSMGPSVEFRYGIMYDLEPLRKDPRYEELIRKANRAWGLNPDGSLPENIDVSTSPADP